MQIRSVLIIAAAIIFAGALAGWASDGSHVDGCFKVGGPNKGKVIVVGQEGLEPACPDGFHTLPIVTSPAAIDANTSPTTETFGMGVEAASISPPVGTYYLVHARLDLLLQGIGANTARCVLSLVGDRPKTLDVAWFTIARHRQEKQWPEASGMLEGWASANTTDRFVLQCDYASSLPGLAPLEGLNAVITLLPIASMNTLNP